MCDYWHGCTCEQNNGHYSRTVHRSYRIYTIMLMVMYCIHEYECNSVIFSRDLYIVQHCRWNILCRRIWQPNELRETVYKGSTDTPLFWKWVYGIWNCWILINMPQYQLEYPSSSAYFETTSPPSGGFGNVGYKTIWRLLNQQFKIRVTQSTVVSIMRILDPIGINDRLSRRLQRRQ